MVKISAFPKCFMDELCIHRTMTVFDWIEMAKPLGAEGLEMYTGFFQAMSNDYIDRVGEVIGRAGYAMPMLCVSPDFTNPNEDERKREVEREIEMIRIAGRLGGPGTACRILSGQRYPEVNIDQGVEWVIECINQCLPAAREHNVVLAMENHYKDGYWKYPEFAQKMDVFLRIIAAISDRRHFGVQYDPSNAVVAGDDPLELLEKVGDRVVTMHASDRYLEPGTSMEDMRQADGTLGYPAGLKHGVTGQGLNDYDRIFARLKAVGFTGWVSIEDGMNGMKDMKESIEFLKHMRAKYFG